MFWWLHATPLRPTALTVPLSDCELETKPIALGSLSTFARIRPSDGSSAAFVETFLPSRNSVVKFVRTPATDVRLIRSIGPLAVAPLTWLQLIVLPVKIELTCDELRVLTGFDLLVTRQIPYLAIGEKTGPAG